MKDVELLSKQQLLELVGQQRNEIAQRDQKLATSQDQLATSQQELARERDITRQLEEKTRQLEKDYLQLFRERFGRKSERYIADANQLRIDFGDTEDASDAADGLAEAVEDEALKSKPTLAAGVRTTMRSRLICHVSKRSLMLTTPTKSVPSMAKNNCFPTRCGMSAKSSC